MTPRSFVKIGLVAAASSLTALAVYAANSPWSDARTSGTKLAPALAASSAKASTIIVSQGGKTLTLVASKDGKWTIKERSDYPAEAEPIRKLLVALSQAELVEPKTRSAERYSVLELEDPATKEAKSRNVRVLDAKGAVLADVIVGKRRFEAFGSDRSATYVRSAKDPQTWLASTEIDAPLEVKRWIKPGIFDADGAKLSDVRIAVPGEDPLEITRVDGKLSFKGLPIEGKKLKDTSAAENISRAAGQLEADDIRKLEQTPTGPGVGIVSLKGDKGLDVVLLLRRDGDAGWVSVTATAEGDGKLTADAINARTKGWEFKIPAAKVDSILRKRSDLQE
jgi:Domain of unknown function (DUF4340)